MLSLSGDFAMAYGSCINNALETSFRSFVVAVAVKAKIFKFLFNTLLSSPICEKHSLKDNPL